MPCRATSFAMPRHAQASEAGASIRSRRWQQVSYLSVDRRLCQFGRIKAVFGVIIVAVFQCMGTVSQGAKPRSPSHLILLVLV